MLHCIWLLLAFVAVAVAVYDDEAFKVDWQFLQLGQPQLSKLTADGDFVVLSKSDILSVVDNNNKGEVKWRQKLNDGVWQSSILEVHRDFIFTSANESLQVWNKNSSFLVKELVLEHPVVQLAVLENNSEYLAAIVDEGNQILLITEHLDVIVGATDLPLVGPVQAQTLPESHVVLVVDSENGYLFDSSKLEIISKSSLPRNDGVLGVWLNKLFLNSNGLISVVEVKDYSDLTKNKVIKTDYKVSQYGLLDLNSYILVSNSEIFPSSLSVTQAFNIDEQFVAGVSDSEVYVFDSEFGVQVAKFSRNSTARITSAHVKFTNAQFLAVFETADLEITSTRNDLVLWSRDESLSHVIEYVIVDPHKDFGQQKKEFSHYMHEEESGVVEGILKRWSQHFKLLYQLETVLKTYTARDYLRGVLGSENLSRAEFGLDQQLIALTGNGNLFNIELDSGKILWKIRGLLESDLQVTKILVGISKDIDIIYSNGDVTQVDFIKGEIVLSKKAQLPSNTKIIPVDYHTKNYNQVYNPDYVTVENRKLQYVSNNKARIPAQAYFSVESDDGVTGYVVNGETKEILPTWSFKVNLEEEKIICTGYNSPNENDKSAIGLALGDKSVLYKYKYPNLGAIAVYNHVQQLITLNIIDLITGKLIKSVSHLQQEKIEVDSFQLVLNDYYLIYSFYSYLPVASTKINVMEFYESKYSDEKTLSNHQNFSSISQQLNDPFIKFKSFNFPLKVEEIIISKTKFDITAKSIILKLGNGQIVLLPKFLLNARRVEGRDLTSQEKEEFMLLPYDANLPVVANDIVTHKRILLNNNQQESIFFSASTNLESTSIVCYLNNDIFCTKIYPSLQFDLLSSSFNKGKLLITIVGLVGITIASQVMVDKKRLNSFWYIS